MGAGAAGEYLLILIKDNKQKCVLTAQSCPTMPRVELLRHNLIELFTLVSKQN